MQHSDTAIVWSEDAWQSFEERTRANARQAPSDPIAWRVVVRASRTVMRAYTTGFFMVSRFLPRAKREDVEVIYATVRYPDEVVDSFPLNTEARFQRIESWAAAYEQALGRGFRENLSKGIPCFLAGFVEIMRRSNLPPEHYRSFLDAMRRDIRPEPFATLDDLIERYIHGSAIVVGYFLAYAYGPATPDAFPRALEASRNLGIGLQLTNFVRDVAEDHRRGRCYIPLDVLRSEGIERLDPADPSQHEGLARAVRKLAAEADRYYAAAADGLDAFAPDCRCAIRACMDVYGQLNRRIRERGGRIGIRESVPASEKWRVLPVSKYWRIPWALLEPLPATTPCCRAPVRESAP